MLNFDAGGNTLATWVARPRAAQRTACSGSGGAEPFSTAIDRGLVEEEAVLCAVGDVLGMELAIRN